jgi:HEAT repeat protein
MKLGIKNCWIVALGLCGASAPLPTPAQDTGTDAYQAIVKREFGTAQQEMTAIEKAIASAKPEEYPQIEARLIAVLDAPDATQPGKQFACQMLRTIASAQCIPSVSKLLTDDKLSHMARFVFLGMRDPAVDEALRRALGQTQGNLRVGIINTLGDRGDRRSVEALAALLSGADEAAALSALNALGKIGGASAADALDRAQMAETLKGAWAHAYLRCAAGLAAADPSRADKMNRSLFEGDYPAPVRAAALGAIAQTQKEQAVPLIVKTLSSSEPLLRRAALTAVVTVPGNPATKALALELAGLSVAGKITLLGALAARGDASGLTDMVNKLAADENPQLREAALKSLARLGDASSVRLLAAALKEGGPVRSEAVRTLVGLQAPGVTEALIAQAQTGDGAVRESLLTVLADRRQVEALPVFRKALTDDDARIRRAALKTLAAMGTQADLARLVEVLPATKDESERDQLAQALSEIGRRMPDKATRCEPILVAWAKADVQTKTCLLPVLAALGGDPALQAVRASLAGEGDLRKAAVRALADWTDAAPMPDLLIVAKEDKDSSTQLLAVRGFIRMAGLPGSPADRKVQAFRSAMELAKRPEEQRLVLAGLADLAHPDALKMVEGCLGDDGLKREAFIAYEKIAESLVSRQPALAGPALKRVVDQATDEGLRSRAKRALDKIK